MSLQVDVQDTLLAKVFMFRRPICPLGFTPPLLGTSSSTGENIWLHERASAEQIRGEFSFATTAAALSFTFLAPF
jgi:hypothetical protein